MEVEEYIEGDKRYIAVSGGSIKADSYARLAFAICVSSALAVSLFGAVGIVVDSFRHAPGFGFGKMAIVVAAHFVSVAVILLTAYPFYRLLARRFFRQRIVFKE